MEKMSKEIEEVLGDLPLAEVTTECLKKLTYLDCVVK